MSRRASRKVDYSEPKDSSEEPVLSPAKKTRIKKVTKVEETTSKTKIGDAKGKVVKVTKLTARSEVKEEEETDEEEEVSTPNRKIGGVNGKTKAYNTPGKNIAQPIEDDENIKLVNSKKAEEAPKRKISSVRGKATLEADKNKKAPAKRKAKKEEDDKDEGEDTQAKKKRKTKEEKGAEAMPILARTAVSTLKKAMHIGAHVSGAGGVQNSINNALHIGGNSFALFLKSQRKWTSPPLAPEARDQFKAFCLEHKYDAAKHVLPHGSYLVNLAQPDADKAEQAYNCFLDDLQRCEQLGIKLYNFHPGNTGPHPRPEAIQRIATQLNKAHKATSTVVTVLENMAGIGNVIGSTWEDLRDIIALVDDKSRVGVCIDTCHAFAAGHDLRTPEAFKQTMESFSSIVGLPYLKALHLNDSKAPLLSNRDLHANIGTGFLGLRAFHNIVNFEPFQDLPMVLETPIDKKGPDGKVVEDKSVWATEIKLLEGLIGIDPETEGFKQEEKRLFSLGADERKKIQDQVDKKKGAVDKKQQKTLDSMFKKAAPKKGKKAAKEEEEHESGCESGCDH